MSDKNTIRKLFTVVTAPVWVPVAAVGGLVTAPFKAAKESVNDAEKSDSVAKGIGMYPVNLMGNIVTSPFKAVGKVGEALFDD